MLRRTLTILSLIGLLLSVGLWGVSYFRFYVGLPPADRVALHEGADDGSVIFDEDGVAKKLDYYRGFMLRALSVPPVVRSPSY
ncbi:MAG: hypothetical protein IIA33_07845 [Planctomycetes bacterium]|nr:hypothetical protein [Planctomycetota bacterium]